MKRLTFAAAAIVTALGVVLFHGVSVRAQGLAPASQPQPRPLTVRAIKPGAIYWVTGGAGGNAGVVIGRTGVLVIDATATGTDATQLLAAIATLTPKPITHVILTNSDGDHVNGLAGFPAGLTIIAHENNKHEQQAALLFATVQVDGGRCLPPADRVPNQLVRKARVVTTIDGIDIELLHFGPAHTSGDLVVSLPDDRVVFAGDLLTDAGPVHPEQGGAFDGWFAAARALLALNATSYIPGHGDSAETTASVRKRMDGYQSVKDRVAGLMRAGRSLAEIRAEMGEPATNGSDCRGIPVPSLSEIAYRAEQSRRQEVK